MHKSVEVESKPAPGVHLVFETYFLTNLEKIVGKGGKNIIIAAEIVPPITLCRNVRCQEGKMKSNKRSTASQEESRIAYETMTSRVAGIFVGWLGVLDSGMWP